MMGQRRRQQSGEHIIKLFVKGYLCKFRKCQPLRQNFVGGTNVARITQGQATNFDGKSTTCNTNQIDVIADTQVLGQIPLITSELTPNVLYTGPAKYVYIGVGSTGRLDNEKRYSSLDDAQKQCSTNPSCNGVTKEADNLGGYTTRAGKLTLLSDYEQTSWAKIDNPSSTSLQALPWKITINTRDWIISKY
jgi:hypothetical protein